MIRSHAAPSVLGMHPSFDALMEITSRPPVVFVEGRGSWLRDQSGKDYLDFVQGWAVNCLGHSPRPIIQALARQAETLINCSPTFYNDQMIRLSNLLSHHSGLHHVFLASSGAEANEGAIKLARSANCMCSNTSKRCARSRARNLSHSVMPARLSTMINSTPSMRLMSRCSSRPMTQVKRVCGHARCSVRSTGTTWQVSPIADSRRMQTLRGGAGRLVMEKW